ncbi:MAG: hypothetical protein E7434_03360, partial [Ruminococcaceae bacterium]|nr:hypothetical protein [Oscillospiraceae bacterium]
MRGVIQKGLSLLLLFCMLAQFIPTFATKTHAATTYTDADWEALIYNYQDSLFGDENVDWTDSEIQKIVGVKNSSGYSTSGLSYEAGRYWVSLEANRSNPNRIFWSKDITLEVTSDTMRRQFIGLFYMARAYGTKGTSYTYKDSSGNKVTLELYQNPDLYDAIFYGLEKGLTFFNYDRWIGYLESPNKGSLYNWWDFAYGTPLEVLRVLLMMYPYATDAQADIAKSYADYCHIFMDKMRPNNDGQYDTTTLGNRRTRLNIGAMIAAVNRDEELMEETRTNLADFMTEHYDWEEGVRPDGSYICHSYWPMEGIYGVGVIVERIIDTYSNMAGTAFALDTADILADWMVDVFRPAMQNGLIMVPFMGRYPENGISAGKQALRGSLMLIDCFDSASNLKLKQFIREMVVQDTEAATAKAYSAAVQSLADVNLAAKLKDIVMDNTISTDDSEYAAMRYCTDRAVQHQKDYTVALSMSSTRIATPESINGQNRYGWFGGDGALYIYNDTTDYDTDQYNATYLRFANMYRVAGTTEENCQLRQPWSNRNAYFPGMTFTFNESTKTPTWTQEKNKDGVDAATFVGGAEMSGKYIAAAMDFEAYSWTEAESVEEVQWIDSTSQKDETVEANKMKQVLVSDLTAKKSYFMFDDEIVCVGSDIDFTTRNNAVNTYVDNRRLEEKTTENGTTTYGTEDIIVDGTLLEKTTTFAAKQYTDPTWVHLESFGGYYFPTGGDVYVNKPFRQSSNDGDNTNDDFNAYNIHVTPTTEAHSFFELYMSHGSKPTDGSYSYVMLPEKDATETEAYTKNPDIKILRNTTSQHVVQETSLGITAMVFWKAGTYGEITVDKPMIVMMQKKDGNYIISASDPTQKLTSGTITINRALSATSLDSEITVSGTTKTVLTVDFSECLGKTVTAEFSMETQPYLMFDFAESDQYMNNTYGYIDYANASRWATGYLDNQTIKISGGFMTLPLTTRKDSSGNITEWRTNIEPSDATANYAWSKDTTKANFLNYDPSEAEIFQVRLKLDNVVAYGDYDPGIYLQYLVDGASCWSNGLASADADYELLKLGIDKACMDGGTLEGKYVTLTLSLENAKLRGFDKIKGIMVQFGYMHGGTATIDYIYIGPKTESLYFGFDNNGDTNRYYEGAYGGFDYDSQEAPAWGSACTDEAANAISVDNAEGTLTVYTGCDYYGSVDYGAYIATSATSGSYPWAGNTNRHPLSFDASDAEIFEIRFKTEDIVAPDGKIPTLYLLTHLETAGVTAGGASPTVQFELKNGEYQTVRIKLTDAIKSADYVKMLGVRFYNTKSAGSGSIGKIIIDYMYLGKAIDAPSNLYFDFDNSSIAQDRYGMESYANLNYDIGSWSYATTRLASPAYSETDGTVSYSMLADAAQGALYLQSSPSLHSNLPLNYVPENAEYIQVRFKLENFTATGTPTFGTYYYAGENSNYNGKDTLKNAASANYTIPTDVLTNGEYVTVTLPVSDSFRACEQITAIRINFANIVSISSDQLGKITIDYVFIGAQSDLPLNHALFFDFGNTAADQERYSNPIYSGFNFDRAEQPYWALWNAASATDFAIDNAVGALTVNVPPKTTTIAGPYLETTAISGTFTWRTEGCFSLKYVPTNAEYLQLRFKVDNCVVTADKEPTIYVLYVGEFDGTVNRIQTINQTYELADGQYQVVTIPLDDTFRSADLIRSLGVCFQNLSSETNGTITLDYMYVGRKAELPIQEEPLFFDFTNTDEDWARYDTKTYGNTNFDAGSWSYSARTTAPTFDWNEGTMSLQMKANAAQSVVYVQSSSNLQNNLNMAYSPNGAEYVQVRFKLENFQAFSTPVMGLYFYQHSTSSVNGADHLSNACTKTYEIDEEHLTDGHYLTVTMPLSSKFINSGTISAIRLNFSGITSLDNDHLGKITVDYIYFGSEANLPREEHLLFDFKNSAADQLRYSNRNYNGFNFDLADQPYWALYCAASATDFSINNSTGTLTVNVPPKTTSIAGPYLETTASYGNFTWRTESYFTLNYEPDAAEYLQIRFKLDDCVVDSGKEAQIYVLYIGDYQGTAQRIQSIYKGYQVTEGEYQVVTIPLDDTFRSAEAIRSIGVRFSNIYSDVGGTATIDYLYVGPRTKLPVAAYTVSFVDPKGNVLDEQLVNSGETAIFAGAAPTKAYDATNHYTFSGWSQSLTNVTSDLTVTAQFSATAHSYSYSKIDNTNHEATCSCGYSKTLSHSWNSGSVTTQPTCTATGVKTFTCSVCKGTKTETVSATGHTEVIDKAVAPTCTETGLTEGKHCSVCNTIIVKQNVVAALGHSYKAVVADPTCTTGGYTIFTCSVCSDSYRGNEVAANGHVEVIDKAVAPT